MPDPSTPSGSPPAASRRDWASHVRPRLSPLHLSPARENEIVDELSQHLEDRWRDLVAGGASEDEATRLALAGFREGNLLAQYMAPLQQAQVPAPITPGASAGHVLRDVSQDLPVCDASVEEAASVHRRCHPHAGTRHRRQHRDVLHRQRGPASAAPIPRTLPLVRGSTNAQRRAVSAENFLDVQREARSFDALGAYAGTGFTLTGRGEPEFVMGQLISAELLDALDVQPLVGRPFRPDENEGGRDQVMLLSHGLWQRRYGGDSGIVGQTITANGKPYTVVGVMPAAFEFPQKRYELWVPFAFRNNAQGMVNRGTHFLRVVGRLARRHLSRAGASGAGRRSGAASRRRTPM